MRQRPRFLYWQILAVAAPPAFYTDRQRHEFLTARISLRQRLRFLYLPILAAAARIGKYKKRSEEHTSELQSPVPISYAVFCLKKKIP